MSDHMAPFSSNPWQATPAFSNPFHDPATEWQRHEHQAEAVLIQAQRLMNEAGTVELAKQALDTVANDREAEMEEFAHGWGFETCQSMVESSHAVVSSDAQGWRVVAVHGDEWVMWNEHDLPHHGFGTDHAAAEDASGQAT